MHTNEIAKEKEIHTHNYHKYPFDLHFKIYQFTS